MRLSDIFKSAESKFKVHFAYDPESCSKQQLSVDLANLSLETFIQIVSKQAQLNIIKQDIQHYLVIQEEIQLSNSKSEKPDQNYPVILKGKVVDALTGEPLVGVIFIVRPDQHISQSDVEGNIRIEFSSKYESHQIESRYLGYQVQRRNIQQYDPDMEWKLVPSVEMLEAITISSVKSDRNFTRDMDMPNLIRLRPNLIQHSSNFQDPMRSMQQLAGINGADDLSSGLQIRGSGTEENLILLDDLTLYSVDHFYGVFSNINPFVLNEVQLYKSYFPSNFGGRASSLLQFKSNQNINRTQIQAELGVIQSNLCIKLPLFNQKLQILAAGRSSTTNLGKTNFFSNLFNEGASGSININRDLDGFVSTAPDFKFNDFYTRVQFTPIRNLKIAGSYFRSFDDVKAQYYNESQFTDLTVQEEYQDTAHWTNEAMSLSAEFKRKNYLSKLSWSQSKLDDQQDIFGIITEIRRGRPPQRRRETSGFINTLEVDHYRWDHQVSMKPLQLNFGVEWNRYHSFLESRINGNIQLRDSLHGGIDQNGFVQVQWSPLKEIQIHMGIRMSAYNRKKDTMYWSPRTSVNIYWTDRFSSSLSWGLYNQFLRQADFEDRFGRLLSYWVQATERRYQVLSSNQIEMTHLFRWNGFQLAAELYFKKITGLQELIYAIPNVIPPPNVPNPPIPRILALRGEGKTYGLDLSLDKSIRNYRMNFSYSYINAKVNFDLVNKGEPYDKRLVRPHQLKLAQYYQYKSWRFSVYGVYGSAQPYVDLSLVGGRERDKISVEEQTKELKYYMRIDTDVQYTFTWKKCKFRTGFNVFNVSNQDNVKYVQYLFNVPVSSGQSQQTKIAGSEISLLPRTFNIYLGFEF